jgi:hypothetical protein
VKFIPARVTTAWLKRHGACVTDVELFALVFPRGVGRITVTHIRKAIKAGIGVEWLAYMFDYMHPARSNECFVCHTERNATEFAAYLRSKQRPK